MSGRVFLYLQKYFPVLLQGHPQITGVKVRFFW